MENYFLDVLLCLHCYTKQKQTGFDKLSKTSEIYIYIYILYHTKYIYNTLLRRECQTSEDSPRSFCSKAQ